MSLVEKKRADRLRVLHGVYGATNGSRSMLVEQSDIVQELALTEDDAEDAIEYLVEEGLLKYETAGPTVSITHEGVRQVEYALGHPKEPTQYFPPAATVINVGTMIGSQIQAGTRHSHQTGAFTTSVDADQLRSFLEALKRDLPALGLPAQERADADAEVATVEAQLGASKPKVSVIRECLTSLRAILEGAAAGAVGGTLVEHLDKVLSALGLGS